jgi:hypothetical protein
LTPLATTGHGEGDTALAMWRENVAPHLGDKLAVLTGDAAYTKAELRAALREVGIVENCHPVSHADREPGLLETKPSQLSEPARSQI